MNQVHELLQSGNLSASVDETMNAVRADSGNVRQRILLFQLLCLNGDWEKARRQLYVLKDMDAETIPMFETYEPVIQCEMFRQAVFEGQRSPLFFGEPRDWLATLSQALPHFAEGRLEQGLELRARAFEQAPVCSGTIVAGDSSAEPFEWIADADGRLGPVLEVFLNGGYYWIAVEHVRLVRIDEPEDLRDLVWTPAEFQWNNGGQAVGFIPTRYPGSEHASDDRLRLSRMTDWLGDDGSDDEDGLQVGVGQRLLATDQGEYPLLGIREISIGDAAGEIVDAPRPEVD